MDFWSSKNNVMGQSTDMSPLVSMLFRTFLNPNYQTLVPEHPQRVAKAHWDHMDKSNLTEMSLLTDNRDRLCEEVLCILGRKNNKL